MNTMCDTEVVSDQCGSQDSSFWSGHLQSLRTEFVQAPVGVVAPTIDRTRPQEKLMEVPKHKQLPILRLKSESGSETLHYPAFYEGFPDEFKRIAEKELFETEKKKEEGIEKLKEIIKRENLTELEDNILVAVLRSCKYDLKKSETKLRNFVRKRQDIVDIVATMDMEKAERFLDDMGFGCLPYRDSRGRAIVYTRGYGVNFDLYDMDDMPPVCFSVVLLLLSLPMTSVAGFVYIMECKSPSIYILYASQKLFRRFMRHVMAFPLRLKKVEVLNEISFIRWAGRIFRPFIGEKNYKRIEFHGESSDKLFESYEPYIIPDAFEGTMGPLSNEHYKQ